MEINNLFVYGSLKNVELFENYFGITPKNVSDSFVEGELYLAEWYPLYLRNKNGRVSGKNLHFKQIPESLLEMLDEYEQIQEGIFIRKSIGLDSDFSWIYEANTLNDFVKKFIYEENRINSGNFELTGKVIKNSERYLR